MHPQIVRDAAGDCPICGMTLEPRTVSLDEEKNPELISLTRRFWVGVILTLPLLIYGHYCDRYLPQVALGFIAF